MVTSFVFSEARIKALKPPAPGAKSYMQEYHKDKTFPGLQVCVTSAGVKTYYIVKRKDGKPVRHRLGSVQQLSVDQARTAARIYVGKDANGENPHEERKARMHEPTLQKLFDHWLIYAKKHKKPKSYKEDERQFNAFLKPWADRRLSSIKRAEVVALHDRIGQKNGPYAANRLLALLAAMFNAMTSQKGKEPKIPDLGYRGDNPAKGVEPLPEVKRDRFLQSHEMAAFFASLDAEQPIFRDFFLLALLTGARRSNIETMRWEQVDLVLGYWRIPETKNGMPVVVPLVQEALAILRERQKEAGPDGWVFPSWGKTGHLVEPKTAWKRILTRAGLSDLRPHDLRRSQASWQAITGASLPIVGKMLGHADQRATQVYARLSLGPVREAAEHAVGAMYQAAGRKQLEGPKQEEGNNNGQ